MIFMINKKSKDNMTKALQELKELMEHVKYSQQILNILKDYPKLYKKVLTWMEHFKNVKNASLLLGFDLA